MTDIQAATDIALAAAAQAPIEAEHVRRMPPLRIIVCAVLALVAQVFWLGLIGWWLLNLF
jgi:uncharacterized membrane protein YccF (DUF307 family)